MKKNVVFLTLFCILAMSAEAQKFTLKQSLSDFREGIVSFGEYWGEYTESWITPKGYSITVAKRYFFRNYQNTNPSDHVDFVYLVSCDKKKKESLTITVIEGEDMRMFTDDNFDGKLDSYTDTYNTTPYSSTHPKQLKLYQKEFEKYLDFGAHG